MLGFIFHHIQDFTMMTTSLRPVSTSGVSVTQVSVSLVLHCKPAAIAKPLELFSQTPEADQHPAIVMLIAVMRNGFRRARKDG